VEPAREKDERCSAKGVLIALPNPTTASARLFGLILPTATRRRPLPVLAADATTASAALFWHMHTHTHTHTHNRRRSITPSQLVDSSALARQARVVLQLVSSGLELQTASRSLVRPPTLTSLSPKRGGCEGPWRWLRTNAGCVCMVERVWRSVFAFWPLMMPPSCSTLYVPGHDARCSLHRR